MAVWTADTVLREQEWCADNHGNAPGFWNAESKCQSRNLAWVRPTQAHCSDCGRDWYYSCPDCGSNNGYFVDPERTNYIAPFYFCIPEDTTKNYPNVSGEPTGPPVLRQRQPVNPAPVYPQQQYQQQHQARVYVPDSPGPFIRFFAFVWAFAAFGVICLVAVFLYDEFVSEEVSWAALIGGGLVGGFLVRSVMRRSSKLAWFLVIAASIVAAFLALTVA